MKNTKKAPNNQVRTAYLAANQAIFSQNSAL
jgi:hypothetical protein